MSIEEMTAQKTKRVKMLVHEFTQGDRFSGWTLMEEGSHILGGIIGNRAYGVLKVSELITVELNNPK